MPLGIVMDERICTGHEYALFWQTLRRYLKHPELTENGAETAPGAQPDDEDEE